MKLVIILVFLMAVLLFLGFALPALLDDDETLYLSETTLKEAVNVEDLTVIKYTYKGIAEKESEFLWLETVDYRVKYEAQVPVSYDMSAIGFSTDEDNKTVTAYLPDAEIGTPVLDETKLGYLPENPDANIGDVLALCKEDATNEINQKADAIRKEALKSLQSTVEALTMPLLNEEYQLEFKSLSEYNESEGGSNEAE
ncbi:DUF4230 domain-containing protein [Adlercreutzia sp. ZJ141]|uniref:DUF4230 domain-containing protein n=1 Tax=Adlercreutzia sp. ZJ141 TaxID=2709406 RepID=UPI0013EA8ECA|nr:DUF4230 domain-containing protein [Adlercreutzia sp. ZJ141]